MGDFGLTQSGTEQVLARLNNLEVMVREQHLATREHLSKWLRECLCIEKSMHEKTCRSLQLAIDGIAAIKQRHQADPALMSGILGLVNSGFLYLQTTSPATAPAIGAVSIGAVSMGGDNTPSTSQQQQQPQQN